MKKIILILFVFVSVVANSQTTLRNGLVEYWKLEGNANGVLGNHNGTANNGPTTATGKIDDALDFDGTNDYINITSAADLNPDAEDFSLSCWVKYEGADLNGDVNPISSKGVYNIDGDEFFWALRGGSPYNGMYGGYRSSSTNDRFYASSSVETTLEDGNWHHVAFVIDEGAGTEQTFYMDGSSIGTLASSSIVVDNTADMYIARYGSNYFDGDIDEFLVHDRALTLLEIELLYQSGNGIFFVWQNFLNDYDYAKFIDYATKYQWNEWTLKI